MDSNTTQNQDAHSNGNNQHQQQAQLAQQYLTIVQDPYPPLNSSPELFDENMPIIDCIQIDELESDSDQIKKENNFIENS